MMSAVALSSGHADNLLESGSFELPAVKGRPSVTNGGDPTRAEGSPWAELKIQPGAPGGTLSAGITDEIARTGKQSLFVDFEKLTAPSRQASLTTTLIPVKPAQAYRISIWGRLDGKRPLALDERRPYMWIDFQFLKADGETASAKSQFSVTTIPGAIAAGAANELRFVSWKWSESVSIIETPAETAFLQVTWTWGVPRDEGETDGLIFWDDAGIEEAAPEPAEAADSPSPNSVPGESTPVASGKPPAAPAKSR